MRDDVEKLISEIFQETAHLTNPEHYRKEDQGWQIPGQYVLGLAKDACLAHYLTRYFLGAEARADAVIKFW